MRVISLKKSEHVYSSNIYLILGDWNRIGDINTIVDVGSNGTVIEEVEKLNTGLGKKPLDQVVLTHGHFDHIGALFSLKRKYGPLVLAFEYMKGVDRLLSDGQFLRLGDRDFEVIHTPGHSNDSICLYCREERVLFSGDTPLRIKTPGGSYIRAFVKALERLAALDIGILYSGHDEPVTGKVNSIIRETLGNVRKSLIVD